MPAALAAAAAGFVTLIATALPSGAAVAPGAARAAGSDVGVLATTPGCGKPPGLNSGTHTLQSGGRTRSYVLRLPNNYDSNRAYRLVFGFHWLGANSGAVTGNNYYGLLPLSGDSTIFVAPEGLNNGWANTNGEDVTFVDNMVQTIQNALCVDTTQLFSLGFSYGGGMSYALACARPNVFRAVAIYGGGVISGCSGGNQPIAYLQAHGISDNVLPISGAKQMRDRFARNNGCNAQNPPDPSPGSGTHTKVVYSGCSAAYPLIWYAFDGGHTPDPTDSGGRIWLPQETWSFFTSLQGDVSPGPTTPTPPVTSSPPPPTTTPPPSSGACQVSVRVNAWNNGLTEDITITNTGSSALNGWSLVFTLPSGQNIISGWNASYSPSSGQVTARNMSYNANIPPNGSVSVGFQATHSGNTAAPASFALNGATCTTA